jgi:hypothetical protein
MGIFENSAKHIFNLFGVMSVYTPPGGLPANVLVVKDKGVQRVSSGESYTTQDFVEMRFLVEKVPNPVKGATVVYDSVTYTVMEETYNDGVVVGVSVT